MDFWPQRGGYPHNIWDRDGLSGGGYFGIAFGALPDDQRSALLWFYNRHLKAADEKAGTPLDAVPPYPHHAVCSFVNWPRDLPERNPAEVLPRSYRDAKWGFYAFRNRWQDENDVVISVLTKASKGNMGAKADGALQIAAFGKKLAWGRVAGDVKRWTSAADGSAVMTMADGTSLAIDFSKASGADVLIAATGPGAGPGRTAEAGGVTYTLTFFTAGPEPEPKVEGGAVIVGGQRLSTSDGHLVLGTMK
jgi:hypothetical protein